MIFYYAFLIFSVIGSFGAHQANIDINRLQRITNEAEHFDSSHYIHGRALDLAPARRYYDYDDYSGGLSEPRSLLHFIHSSATPYPKNTVKIHQPRENPKLYYQSDDYVKKVSAKNIAHDASAIYPGREVIRIGEYGSPNVLPRKTRNKESQIYSAYKQCILCPRDRTIITRAGSDRALLKSPRLATCSGHMASNKVKFIHMYGPKFGSYVTRGFHTMVGRITFDGETLRLCKMEVHVIVQSCPVPRYLVPHCDQLNKSCNFTCKDSRLEVIGETSAVCGEYMEWENELPVCKARTWCKLPVPPEQGRISCKGNHVGGGAGMLEGTKCRIRCAPEWRPALRGVTVCRRGVWTHDLLCQPKGRYPKG